MTTTPPLPAPATANAALMTAMIDAARYIAAWNEDRAGDGEFDWIPAAADLISYISDRYESIRLDDNLDAYLELIADDNFREIAFTCNFDTPLFHLMNIHPED